MTTCPCCHQLILDTPATLTPRELDLLTAWWRLKSVKKAAVAIGVGEQRAKNMLANARNRSHVKSNADLLRLHLDALAAKVEVVVSQTSDRSAA